MSDDIFLAEASQKPTVENSRKLPHMYYKNKISITMCDVWDGVEGSPEKRPYDVSHGQNRYVRLH
jgi:hypothetical protein